MDGRARDIQVQVDDLTREQRKADADVEQVKARRVRDQQRLDGGTVSNPKDLERLQHELVSLDRRVTELEDAELEVMEQLEEAQQVLDGLGIRAEDIDARLAELVAARDEKQAGIDASLAEVAAAVPASRLPEHPLVATDAVGRLLHARGQSFPDLIAMRANRVDAFPDGVAYPRDAAEVRALLDFAADSGARLIPYGGGTSVVGHVTALAGGAPVLTVSLGRMSRLTELDVRSRLATFGAGVAGPLLSGCRSSTTQLPSSSRADTWTPQPSAATADGMPGTRAMTKARSRASGWTAPITLRAMLRGNGWRRCGRTSPAAATT